MKAAERPGYAHVCPRLHPHLSVHPLTYRAERWYLLRNQSNMQTLRLNDTAYAAVALMDGYHSLADIAEFTAARFGDEAPTLEELGWLLLQLANAQCVLDGLPAEFAGLLQNRAATRGQWRLQRFTPTAVRVPLWNPVRFLERLRGFAETLFAPATMTLWLLCLLGSMVLAAAAHTEIAAALTPSLWEPDHALVLGVVYLLVKLVHELSHALAIRAWGGEVREVGLMFLWFLPCPYVDGSASAVFPDKRKRALVAAAGILAEMTLAALGLAVFLLVEPGLVRTLALDVMLVGTVSTLLANGNPFLKFDGYYVLEDLIEIPNLATRAQRYYLYLIQRYGFGQAHAASPVTSPGERPWFLIYAPIALAYRVVLLLGIALAFSERYLAAGIAIALFALVGQLLLPMVRGAHYVLSAPALAACRGRALSATGGALALLVLLLGVVPIPSSTRAEGVVGTAGQGTLYSGADGFVREILARPYTQVRAGQPLLRLENAELATRLAKLDAQQRALEAQRLSVFRTDRAEAAALAAQLRALAREQKLVAQQARSLVLVSPVDGEFAPLDPRRLADRFCRKGELLGHVITPARRVVKAVVTQNEIGQVRAGVLQTRVRLAERPFDELAGSDLRETPAGEQKLPSVSLGVLGGGRLAVDAADASGLTAAERVFTLEFALPPPAMTAGIGGRAYVRFDHPAEPLATQLFRALEQLLLQRLDV